MDFEITPVVPATPREGLQGNQLQIRNEGTNLGDANVRVIDFISDPAELTVTRGWGENRHIITVRKIPPASCPNGPLWTERVASSSKRWASVVFGGAAGFCVAGGINPVSTRPAAMYSTDYGVTWNESPTAFPDTSGYGFVAGAFAFNSTSGVYLGALNAAQMARSTDGQNWSIVSPPAVAAAASTMEAGGGVFVYVRDGTTTQAYTSPDGLAWTARTLPASKTWATIGYGSNGTWIVTASDGSTARSVDGGATWTAGGALPVASDLNSLAYGNGVWVGTLSALETRLVYSTDDGLTWQYTAALQGSTTIWQRVRFVAGIFYLVNSGGVNCYKSSVGSSGWSAANSLVNMASFSIEWACDDVSPFHYVAVGNAGSATTVTNSGVCG